jgi:hypothetical protein
MLLSPCLLHLLLELWIVFSFFFFLGLSLHVEQVIWIRIITLTTPHLPAWCIFSDTPEDICTKDPSSPIPFLLHSAQSPSQMERFGCGPKLPQRVAEEWERDSKWLEVRTSRQAKTKYQQAHQTQCQTLCKALSFQQKTGQTKTWRKSCHLILAFRNSFMASEADTGKGSQTKVPGWIL